MAKNKPKILVVEDDKFLLKAYKIKFDKSGFEAIIASDGIEGLAATKKELPSVIVLDLMLPRMNGFEFLKAIKSDEKTKNIPVIALSNLGQKSDQEKTMELGASEYLIKTDYSLEEIADKIKKHII